ncbi:modification methylase HpaII [Methanobrevibacter woesei]|uniref:DNA (cytosine-5-)-methyltransferase n=1 Tax=Methanobrevibacter woesei TaxID=190976 RepID=A0A2U1S6R6_9EURY|nr:DNA (cytosine-5-)-methyltransferase [Methanobrevibacter woesei]PWB85772.1 modification methylase HpaII [Methanobrevibacter woesei]
MIRLATVFSGIGAVEHALNRMGLDNEIVFACDNGDIDIFSKKIDVDMDQIGTEISSLNALINNMKYSEDDDYELQLANMFNDVTTRFEYIQNMLKSINITNEEKKVKDILKIIIKTPHLNKRRIKVYTDFLNDLNSNCSNINKKLLLFKIILKITNDFKKDNSMKNLGKDDINFLSAYNIDWSLINKPLKLLYNFMEVNNGKKLIREVKDLSQRVGQLYGKINTLHHLKKMESLDSFSKKKKYVDTLYKGNEKRNKVKISYMSNYNCPEEHFHWDVTFLDGNHYKNQVDLFVGGSPCQSFSLVGKQRGLSDTRGTLFYDYARLINEICPKVFIYENVRAVLSNDCGRTWEKMKEVFEQLNYDVYYTNEGKPSILNAKDYGIPQNRERLFVVGFRSDLKLKQKFKFPKKMELKKKMQDFLIDNAPGGYFLPKKGVEFVTKEKNLNKKYTQIDGNIALCQKKNQEFNWHGDFIFQSEKDAKKNNIPDLEKYFLSEKVKKYVLSSGTKNFYSKPKTDLDVARPLLTTMHKMHRAGVDNYVTTEGRLRKLTPRECLRLMGFSDDWKIVVSDTAMYQQAGNSIVVDVLIQIINEIIKCYPSLIKSNGEKYE